MYYHNWPLLYGVFQFLVFMCTIIIYRFECNISSYNFCLHFWDWQLFNELLHEFTIAKVIISFVFAFDNFSYRHYYNWLLLHAVVPLTTSVCTIAVCCINNINIGNNNTNNTSNSIIALNNSFEIDRQTLTFSLIELLWQLKMYKNRW